MISEPVTRPGIAQSPAPGKAILWDIGHMARELNRREEQLLRGVCAKLGLEVDQVDG
jgi:hypothetical protein